MGTGVYFTVSRAVRAWSWQVTSIWRRG